MESWPWSLHQCIRHEWFEPSREIYHSIVRNVGCYFHRAHVGEVVLVGDDCDDCVPNLGK